MRVEEIRRNPQANTPINPQKSPSKNTPSKTVFLRISMILRKS